MNCRTRRRSGSPEVSSRNGIMTVSVLQRYLDLLADRIIRHAPIGCLNETDPLLIIIGMACAILPKVFSLFFQPILS